jgi:hypothetical protein
MSGSTETETRNGIEVYQSMPLDIFRKRFSKDFSAPSPFSDPVGYFTTNEHDYVESMKKIHVRRGIHLAVMGGVDPVLGQLAVACPDLTVMMDINGQAIDTAVEGRIKPIPGSNTEEDYWDKVTSYITALMIRRTGTSDFPRRYSRGPGTWSDAQYLPVVQAALKKGKIKFATGDVMSHGLDVIKEIATESGIPLRLLYISNIFEYALHMQDGFKTRLQEGVTQGWIDETTQVLENVFTGRNTTTEVMGIKDFIAKPSRKRIF